jgi:hypothetical protein
LIIRLIIQTIRQDLSGSVQIDAEHQATDLVLMEFVGWGVAAGYRLSRSRSLLVSRSSM